MNTEEKEELNLFLQPREEVSVLPVENQSMLQATKADLSGMVSDVVEGVDDGNSDALDTYILAKKGFYVFEGIVEAMKGKVTLPQAKGYSKHSCEFREQATGVSYSFDRCNDPVWEKLSAESSALKIKLKEREDFLKGLKGGTDVEVVDEETGEAETYTMYPPVKMAGQSVVLTIK